MKKYRTWKPTENFKLMELEQIVDEGNKAHEWAVKVVRHLKLRQIMDAHGLTAKKTADLLSVSLSTVQHWRVRPDAAGFNPIPTGMLELLEIKLGERQ
jgi:DNA-binding transcriptional regulator YiaG|tara:strand:- start:209 stop:502 length:294 start_codon:yes stop_codon:yes gene_type:complete